MLWLIMISSLAAHTGPIHSGLVWPLCPPSSPSQWLHTSPCTILPILTPSVTYLPQSSTSYHLYFTQTYRHCDCDYTIDSTSPNQPTLHIPSPITPLPRIYSNPKHQVCGISLKYICQKYRVRIYLILVIWLKILTVRSKTRKACVVHCLFSTIQNIFERKSWTKLIAI